MKGEHGNLSCQQTQKQKFPKKGVAIERHWKTVWKTLQTIEFYDNTGALATISLASIKWIAQQEKGIFLKLLEERRFKLSFSEHNIYVQKRNILEGELKKFINLWFRRGLLLLSVTSLISGGKANWRFWTKLDMMWRFSGWEREYAIVNSLQKIFGWGDGVCDHCSFVYDKLSELYSIDYT